MVTDDFRAYQSSVGSAISSALRGSSVKYVVNLSSIGAELDSGNGPIAGLHGLEEALNAIPELNVLHLRAAYFYENFLFSIGMIQNLGINGGPNMPDAPFPMITVQDVGAYAAERLLKLDFTGKNVHNLMGPRELTFAEVTGVLGKAIGRDDLPYVQFPYDQAEQGMIAAGLKPKLAALYVEMARAMNEERLTFDDKSPVIQTHTAIEDFAKTFARAYKL
jgi:uncharacterized protein YbjT (DUF2867 family)